MSITGWTIGAGWTVGPGWTLGLTGGGGSAPVTSGTSVSAAARGATYTYDLTPYITGSPTSITITTPPSQGSATVSGLSIIYTAPNTGSPGSDLIGYTATNAYGTSNASIVGITITCCVVANALTGNGLWSKRQYHAMHTWGAARLDKHPVGRALHRGYNMIAPKYMVPHISRPDTRIGRYMKWTFENGTNLLRGKKYSWLSMPNTALWVTAMTITGLFTSEKQAQRNMLQNSKK